MTVFAASSSIATNQIANWPAGPEISAEAAYLIEANTGTVLYAKNIDERLYPASTTKLLTCLIAAEHCEMDEMISFSQKAVFSLDEGSSTIGIDPGQSMPLKECLYGILTASANEVANAVAEHVAGSQEAFAQMMNEKAKELGCTNSHFMNAHGLHNDNHYTSAHDLALIAKAFFQNEQLSKIADTATYHFEPTATQPDDFIVRNKHQLINGDIPYEGIKGGKTGYTEQANQTLVTCAEQNDMKLISVVLKEDNPYQFTDTVLLLDYGFSNFAVEYVANYDTSYIIETSHFFHSSSDLMGDSRQLISLNKNSYVIMPKTVTFEDLDSEISYDTDNSDEIAIVKYYYHGAYVGMATIDSVKQSKFLQPEADSSTAPKIYIINIKIILFWMIAVTVLVSVILYTRSVIKNYSFMDALKRKHHRRKRIDKKKGPHF